MAQMMAQSWTHSSPMVSDQRKRYRCSLTNACPDGGVEETITNTEEVIDKKALTIMLVRKIRSKKEDLSLL